MFGLSEVATRIIGIALVVVGLFGFGYYRGHHAVQVKFDAYKADVEAAAEEQKKHVEAVTAQQQQITQGVKNDYEKRLADLRAYYRLRPNGSSVLPKLPNATSGTDAASSNDLPYQCAITTEQLVTLQKWVNEQQQVKE